MVEMLLAVLVTAQQRVDVWILVALVGAAAAIGMWLWPADKCRHCLHCKQIVLQKQEYKRKEHERRQAEAHQTYHRMHGKAYCPYCIDSERDKVE